MTRNLTSEEVQAKHIAAMGPDLGPVYHGLWNECAWLHVKWQEYQELYGTRQARVDLLNSAASLFFKVVQDALWDDTLLHVARLTDPAGSGARRNLSVLQLRELISSEELRREVLTLADVALAKATFARDWRNRRIAHRDLALALEEGARPLAAANREQVSEALAAIAAVLNRISQHYFDATIFFDMLTHSHGAVSMLYVLRDGLAAEDKRRERARAGRPDPDDLRHYEI